MGDVLFAHVYGMNAIPAPLPAALVDRGKLRVLHRAGWRQAGVGVCLLRERVRPSIERELLTRDKAFLIAVDATHELRRGRQT